MAEKKKDLSWDTRDKRFENSLAGQRESLLEALIIAKNSFSCFRSFCNVRTVDIACDDSGRNSKLCSVCDEGIHSYCPMHDRYGIVHCPMHDWYCIIHGQLQQLTPLQPVSCEGEIVDNGKLKAIRWYVCRIIWHVCADYSKYLTTTIICNSWMLTKNL